MKAHYKWWLLLLLGGAYFFHQADRAIFGVLVPDLQGELGLTDLQLGHINTILFLTIAIATFFAGFLGDKLNRKWIITLSLIFWSLATMGMGFAATYLSVVLLRSLATGGGESFYGPSAMSLLASYHDKTRSFAFSLHQAALYLGLMLSGVLALWILGIVGNWRGVFIVFGLAGLLLGIAFVFLLRENREERSATPKASLMKSFKVYFTNPSALLATTGFVAICCVNNTYLTWVPKMVHQRFQIESAEAGAYVMFYHHLVAFAAIIVGGIITDYFVCRYPRFRLALQIVALLLGAPVIMMIGKSDSFVFAIAMTAMYGLFRGLFEVNTHASVFDVIPAEHRASVVGFMLLLAMGIGALFSGELVGWIMHSFGERAYGICFVLMGGTYLFAALMMMVAFFFTFRRDYRAVHPV